MAWTTEPEISHNENGNQDETPAASSAKASGKKSNVGTDGKSPTELMVCQGAKCTCDQAVDPSPKELKVLSHQKYIINEGS